ncbi:energy-coupling factor transporter transmembrane component T family protein [Haloplasma contractile]|uniref:Cobalt ABC transporter permease CbiQ protein n=1 Tax=Haloplasma contractile SSD-17B TaxID=1033810 RepID=U2FQ34_9MOLU|nr:energy-coupling factor transporter transmembrane component T [Haloplasma contractile]ERJ13159.1 cobalt ABC transporter permease CbiQ protein [Haloplasma contractile SSD-17B]
MQLEFTSKYTWLHKINPSLKFIIVTLVFIAVLFVHNINVLINLVIGFLTLYVLYTGHPYKRLLFVSIPFIIIFISSITSMIFFGQGDTTWYKIGLIHITEESFFRGLHVGIRGLLYALVGVLFALTTRPVMLFYSFMQQLKIKPKYAYSFMAAIRLVSIMIEELQILRYALKVRGVKEAKGIKGMYQQIKAYFIPLLSQSIRRAHRIAVAMEAKRFTNYKRTYYYKVGYSMNDLIYIIYICVIAFCSYYLAANFPYLSIQDVR